AVGRSHGLHGAAAATEHLGDGADGGLGQVADDALEGLHLLALDLLHDDLGPAHAHLVALAAHLLDEHREHELAAADDAEAVGAVGLLDAQRDVAAQLAEEAVAELARGDVLALLAG